MRAAILLRLSEEKDTEEKTEAAFERFEQVCRALCEQRGWTVVDVFNEGIVSAYSKRRKRDTFEKAMRALETRAVDVLVVPYVDRFCRGYAEPARAEAAMNRSGGDIIDSTGRSATNDETWHVLVGLAIAESKRISRRVKAQRLQAAIAGKPNQGGRRLYGYTTLPRTIIEDEAAVIREAVRRLLSGHSQRSVTAWANTVSKTTTGREWSQRTLREMLLSPALAGLRVYKGEIVAQGNWEAILKRERWEQVAALLKSRPTRGAPVKHLLSGIIACGKCETSLMTHYEPRGRGGRRQYMCPKNIGLGRPGCGRLTVAAEAVERVVTAMVLKRLAGPGLARALAARDAEQGAGIAAELAAVDAQVAEIEEMWKRGKVKGDAFLRLHTPMVAKADELRSRLRQDADGSILHELPSAKEELEAWWDSEETSLDQRRAVIQAVVDRVPVGPALKASRTFDERRLRPPFGPQWKDRRPETPQGRP
jgi:site-specific DNA recombinase